MAIIKHIPVKNRFYTVAVQYLSCKYDERTNRPYVDEKGRYIEREDYRIEGYNCDAETFGADCIEVNNRFGKNNSRKDVKAHHYIISFAPEDEITLDGAMEFGKRWISVFAPGHQAVIAAHPDGHNASGNVHVHIVLNSVRKFAQTKEAWHEKACEYKEGCKHRSTGRMMRAAKKWVMERCIDLGLYQVDLLANKHSDHYRVNERLKEKEIETGVGRKSDKDTIRSIIDDCVSRYDSFEGMVRFLRDILEWDIRITEKTISYRMPDMKRPVRGKRLGEDYDVFGIHQRFEKKKQHKREANAEVVQSILKKYEDIAKLTREVDGYDEYGREGAVIPASDGGFGKDSYRAGYEYRSDIRKSGEYEKFDESEDIEAFIAGQLAQRAESERYADNKLQKRRDRESERADREIARERQRVERSKEADRVLSQSKRELREEGTRVR